MVDLLNNLTLTISWIIHNFELQSVNLKFRFLPTKDTLVITVLEDWKEFDINFEKKSLGSSAMIGKSKAEILTLILNDYNKYKTYNSDIKAYIIEHVEYADSFAQWQVKVQSEPELAAPKEPPRPEINYQKELEALFEYITMAGIK